MVILGSISTFCCATVRSCICCKKNDTKSAQTSTSQTMSKTLHSVWTTAAESYDTTSTITALEANPPSCTGILNHNFQPLGLKPAANLPDVTAATSMLPSTGMKMLYTQGHLCEDKQCNTNDNILHDAWSFSGSFTLEPRRSKEVTEL